MCKIGTDDSTLMLDGLARTFLGNLFSDTLLMHFAINCGPGDLSGIFTL